MRSLRIGVVIAGQLVEERVFSKAVTFGQALRCDISVPLDGVPREHVLFDSEFVLHPSPGMAVARNEKRGKLQLGQLTILFQEVDRIVQPKPKLPASLRVHHFDRKLAAIVAGSILVHTAIGIIAWTHDNDVPGMGMRDVPVAFTQDTIDVELPDHVERIDPTTIGPAVATPITPTRHIVQPPPVSSPTDPQRLAEAASSMASILTGDDGAHGFGGMNHRQPGADLARQMDEASHHTVVVGGTRHEEPSRIGTDRGLQISDPTLQTPVPAHNEEVGGRIQLQPIATDGGTTLTAQMVLDKVTTAYMTGLQRCYRIGQREDAGLEGKIAIELTVDEHGRVTDPSATGLTRAVDSCMSTQMATWHFGIPKDKDGEATQATFKIALVLQKS